MLLEYSVRHVIDGVITEDLSLKSTLKLIKCGYPTLQRHVTNNTITTSGYQVKRGIGAWKPTIIDADVVLRCGRPYAYNSLLDITCTSSDLNRLSQLISELYPSFAISAWGLGYTFRRNIDSKMAWLTHYQFGPYVLRSPNTFKNITIN